MDPFPRKLSLVLARKETYFLALLLQLTSRKSHKAVKCAVMFCCLQVSETYYEKEPEPNHNVKLTILVT